MSTKIIYNDKDVSIDYYDHTGEYWDIIQKMLFRSEKWELSVLSNTLGKGLVFDPRFRVVIDGASHDYIKDFMNREKKEVNFEFCIRDSRFCRGSFFFTLSPDRIEICDDDDNIVTICLIVDNKEFVLSNDLSI